jgi:oligoribonuclease NrnB/cAMP/cGMP phosphodiesterase (DHH superfamily)
MKPLVLYHAGCWDGFCAAWVARKAIGDIEAIPVNYGEPPPIDVCGRDVYILDFSYPRDVMKTIVGQSAFVCCLDHHKTAQDALAGLADEVAGGKADCIIRFDMDKSGGRLAWEYFFEQRHAPAQTEPMSRPWLVDYTEDRDLWRHALPGSKFVNAFIRSFPLTFECWDEFEKIRRLTTSWDAMLVGGESIVRREKQIVDSHVNFAYEMELAGHKIRAVNATVLSSEIAGELAKGQPFGACYFDQEKDRVWSLRSEASGVDVSAVAKQFGGGGHKNAAGFKANK